jgi:hypothetical protein
MPEMVRASRMPNSKPLITVPTTCPRRSTLASDATMGTRIWAATDPAPTISATPMSRPMSGETAETTRLVAVTIMTSGMSRRRETRSPTGTRRARPAA